LTKDSIAPIEAIDYGCGSGGTTLNFSYFLNQPITGYDVFDTQLKIGREFSSRHGSVCKFELLKENGKIPISDKSVDLILSLDVLGHVPNIPNVLEEWSRVLKVGGSVSLFTEANYSQDDSSMMAQLAKAGWDMATVVPEHISLFSREMLEEMFKKQGFKIESRYSANVWHFFFFPKDYVLLLNQDAVQKRTWIYRLAWMWNRLSKIMPFYPWPFQTLRLVATYLFGKKAYGTSYFYHLIKI
jgi:ubiquinone/menaquinone biosynthesis C-methylase UbiE